MGGQRLPIRRPRVHSVDDGGQVGEVALASHGVFAQGDLLERTVIERLLSGVATRSFARAADPIGDKQRAQARSTSKSAVSRRFVTGTNKALDQLLSRDRCPTPPRRRHAHRSRPDPRPTFALDPVVHNRLPAIASEFSRWSARSSSRATPDVGLSPQRSIVEHHMINLYVGAVGCPPST